MLTTESIFLQFNRVETDYARLNCRLPGAAHSEERSLPLSQIENLLKQAQQDYYTVRPDIAEIGKKLYTWLDGDERWLARALTTSIAPLLVLHVSIDGKNAAPLRYLPWEALHDGTQFLVQRPKPVVAVRSLPQMRQERRPQKRPLFTVFMATSPEGVEPPLDFEKEESAILQATTDLPLVLRVEESGNLELLGKRLERYGTDEVDILHLTGHAGMLKDKPIFITESETGERVDADIDAIAQAFQFRVPPLVFLSGCRTGQSGSDGAIPSMAEALVERGAQAVLGWALPIEDTTATLAAAQLYSHLASGCVLAEALSRTYTHLLQNQAQIRTTNWHLLRLYVRGECPGALVEPIGEEVWQVPASATEQFLDPEQKVRVATADQFVGRRRLLQKGLKSLQSRNFIGVILHGLGGIGKSSLAARLLERLVGYDPIVLYQDLSEDRLGSRLASQCVSEAGHAILNSALPIAQKWQRFLKEGLNTPNQRFAFVLDDFEANLESNTEGKPVLKPSVVVVLRSLLDAIKQSGLPHRIIITSRYDFTAPDQRLNVLLERFQVTALQGADLIKKCERLQAFHYQDGAEQSLRTQALKLADGNPRLLERLDKVLLDEGLDRQAILEKLETTETQYREEILVEQLLQQQASELRRMLAQGRIYELSVPREAFEAVCFDVDALSEHIARACTLGLLEEGLLDGSLRVPQLVVAEPAEPMQPLAKLAIEALYPLWWEKTERILETQVLEILRLSCVAEDWKKVKVLTNATAQQWYEWGRYRDAALLWREMVQLSLSLFGEEHPDTSISMNNLAQMLYFQGDYAGARNLQEQVLVVHRRVLGEEHPDTLISMGNLASTLSRQGEYVGARQLQEQVLVVHRRISGEEHPDTLTSMTNLAQTLYSQRDYSGARQLQEQVLVVHRRVLGEEHPDTLRSIHNLAGTLSDQRDYSGARQLQKQVLKVRRRVLGEEHPDTLSSMNNLAGTLYFQSDYATACRLWEQVLKVRRRVLGEEHPGTLTSMNNLAAALEAQGDYEQAELLYVQGIEILHRCLGSEHPNAQKGLKNYLTFLSGIVQNHPEAVAKLLSNGSAMTKQILEQMQSGSS
jgi:tetratricopeptide (TPR) repeat protein